MKTCSICKLPKDEKDFYKKSSTNDGLQIKCKECQQQYFRDYYSKNKISVKKRTGKRRDENRNHLREIVVEHLLSHPCIDCGEKDIILLDFDHVNGNKLWNISDIIRLNMPDNRLHSELEKCVVRCVSCHRRKTAKDFGWYKLAIISHK